MSSLSRFCTEERFSDACKNKNEKKKKKKKKKLKLKKCKGNQM